MGDERTYDYAIALRAVETQDFMTADFRVCRGELLDTVSRRIVNEVKGVNRILYDVTSKPPPRWSWSDRPSNQFNVLSSQSPRLRSGGFAYIRAMIL